MNNRSHEIGRILYAGNQFALRNEINGMTVYNRFDNTFRFYEGLLIEDVEEELDRESEIAVIRLMRENQEHLTKNMQSENPLNICWMVSGICNLDCIYCFAENKMVRKKSGKTETDDRFEILNQVLSLKPISMVLSGGEPTLNPNLADILRFCNGKVCVILDTNGTTPQLEKLITTIMETHTTVRLTVDILDDEILNTVRPRFRSGLSDGDADPFPQSEILKKNIRALTDAGIPLVIHTVLTRYNIGKLETTAEMLIRSGAKEWFFYPVNYSLKCKDFFDEIKVSRKEACEYVDTLAEKFGDQMKITCPRNDVGFRERCVLLVDHRGRFYVDTVDHGPIFLGEDPTHPQKTEIMAHFDFDLHKQTYLCNFWQIANQ